MDFEALTRRLKKNGEAIRGAVVGIDPEAARWKPSPDSWSIVEVINHLHDEEREDFRARLRSTLEAPETAWKGIDPQGWVTERSYNERDLEESLAKFLEERSRSVVWLGGLDSPPWDLVYEHPDFGSISAGELFAAWVAHDLLHLRQLARIQLQWTQAKAEPFSTRYAGEW